MVSINQERKHEIFDNFQGKKIAVLGDLMLDRYLWGNVARISPEAPVPVVEIETDATQLGGAANVVNNLASLGTVPYPFGVVGNDADGKQLIQLFREMNLPTDGILIDDKRMTSVKTRIIAHNQHVVRADRETVAPISAETCARLIDRLMVVVKECDAVIFQDYNKGLLTPESIRLFIDLIQKHQRIITVDPKFENFFNYKNVTLFKPNRVETEQALSIRIRTDDDVGEAIIELKKRLQCENVLITLGEKGMCLLEWDETLTFIPTRAQHVHDVSGAGDTVISTLTVALAAGATMKEATTIANYAAGIVCSEVGAVPVKFETLRKVVQ